VQIPEPELSFTTTELEGKGMPVRKQQLIAPAVVEVVQLERQLTEKVE
jgi:hypothetical protein